MYEVVLNAAFEVKMKQVATSPDIPLFKKLKENWETSIPRKYSAIEKL